MAAIGTVLWVVFPQITGPGRGSWVHWAACTPEELLADLAPERRAEAVVGMAKRVKAKYIMVRVAVVLTAAGFALLLAAAVPALW